MNGEMFLAWVEQGLAPILRAGELVILDNLATHKIRGVREAMEARGAGLLYLRPYSPNFNPIEPPQNSNRGEYGPMPCPVLLQSVFS
jgi:transposase